MAKKKGSKKGSSHKTHKGSHKGKKGSKKGSKKSASKTRKGPTIRQMHARATKELQAVRERVSVLETESEMHSKGLVHLANEVGGLRRDVHGHLKIVAHAAA